MNPGKTSRPTSTLVCEACTEDKQYMMKWGNDAEGQVTKALEIVHLDVYSPTKYTSVEGANHFGTFVYVFLKNVWVYMMKSKESGFEKFE